MGGSTAGDTFGGTELGTGPENEQDEMKRKYSGLVK